MIYFRSSLFAVGYFIFTTLYGAMSIPLRVLPPLTRHRIIISWTRVIVFWARLSCGLRYRVVGLENIQHLHKPVVILSKHQSAWETFYLQNLFWPASTVLKKELLNIPFFGWGLSSLRPIAIDRSNPREALKQIKQQGLEQLREGLNLILFPEGTRVPIGTRVKYARGGADIAKEAAKYVVPIAHDAGRYWGRDSKFLKYPGTITVVIGQPIDAQQHTSKELTERVESWIEATLEEILAGRYASIPAKN